MRASPASITATTPSMVTEVSATLVDRITLRRPPGSGRTARFWSGSDISPWSGTTANRSPGSASPSASAARRISPAPGRNTSRSPSGSSRIARRTAAAICCASGRVSGSARCSMATSNARPSERTRAHAPALLVVEKRAHRIGVERGRHDADAEIRPRAGAQRAHQRQRQVAGDVPLVELVEHDRGHAGQRRLRQQAAQQDPLGDEANARVGPRPVLEAHRIADGLAGGLTQLGGDALGGQARRQPARLDDDDLAAARIGEPRVEQRARHARGLAGAGRRLDDHRARRAQRGDDLGQLAVDRKGIHRPRATRVGEPPCDAQLPARSRGPRRAD